MRLLCDTVLIVEITNIKLTQTYLVYDENFLKDKETYMYIEVVRRQSLSSSIRQAVAGDIRLISGIFYTKELMPEQKVSKRNSLDTLYTLPVILLHMLAYLYTCRHDESTDIISPCGQ